MITKQALSSDEILAKVAKLQEKSRELLAEGKAQELLEVSSEVAELCNQLGKAYVREAKTESNEAKLKQLLTLLPTDKQAKLLAEQLSRGQK